MSDTPVISRAPMSDERLEAIIEILYTRVLETAEARAEVRHRIAEELLTEVQRMREPVRMSQVSASSSGEAFIEWYRCQSCDGVISVLSALGNPDFCGCCGRPLTWL
jgi:hypothetical protein